MSEQSFQRALARIYTDVSVRELFLAGNESSLAEYSLTTHELERLRQLRNESRERLDFFSSLLSKKRGSTVRALLPLSFMVCGEQLWDEAWSAYCQTRRMEIAAPPSNDALGFTVFLKEFVADNPLAERWIKEIIIYERCKIHVASSTSSGKLPGDLIAAPLAADLGHLYPVVRRPFKVQLFATDVTRIISRLKHQRHLPEVETKPALIIFYRKWDVENVRTAKINNWMSELLKRCDGQTDVNTIVEWLSNHSDVEAEMLSRACARALLQLEQQGVLVFSHRPQGEFNAGGV